jgi:hypothetical protein
MSVLYVAKMYNSKLSRVLVLMASILAVDFFTLKCNFMKTPVPYFAGRGTVKFCKYVSVFRGVFYNNQQGIKLI